MRYRVELSIDAPALGDIQIEDLHDYIMEAIDTWGGQFDPINPFFMV